MDYRLAGVADEDQGPEAMDEMLQLLNQIVADDQIGWMSLRSTEASLARPPQDPGPMATERSAASV
jgi:hypothetical protein